ncbi:MAG: sensor histidine kinase [Campylobacterota bacterium]
MLSQKESLKTKFLFRLTAVIALLLVLSFALLYIHANSRISQNLTVRLDTIASNVKAHGDNDIFSHAAVFGVEVDFNEVCNEATFFSKNDRQYLKKTYPYKDRFMTLIMDVTTTKSLENDILNAIWILVSFTTIAILFYVSFLTRTFLQPIFTLSEKLSDMNENYMKAIDIKSLPLEFRSLGNSINKLVNRIQNYIKYQKELFTGVSHELKTPLAVLKTKNQVVLIKDRDVEKYKQTLKENNEIVDEVNRMISTVLEFGRQESAQFEAAADMDLMAFLRKKIDDFAVITNDKTISADVPQETVMMQLQPTLLNQVFQNLMQNAIKFAKSRVQVNVYNNAKQVRVEIIDDGKGIDKDLDIFAPFKRTNASEGIGLGLYLAKSAADAIGAHIDITNNSDQGAKAIIVIEKHPSVKLS